MGIVPIYARKHLPKDEPFASLHPDNSYLNPPSSL